MNMNRFIKSTKVSILQDDGFEPLVKFELHGQSFIYHQIRNMIGSMVQLFQRPYSLHYESKDPCVGIKDIPIENLENLLGETFKHHKVRIWLAPSEGLYLQDLYFSSYNLRKRIPETLQLTPEEETVRELWCEKHIVEEVKTWARTSEEVSDWLLKFVRWDRLERIEGQNIQELYEKNAASGEQLAKFN